MKKQQEELQRQLRMREAEDMLESKMLTLKLLEEKEEKRQQNAADTQVQVEEPQPYDADHAAFGDA